MPDSRARYDRAPAEDGDLVPARPLGKLAAPVAVTAAEVAALSRAANPAEVDAIIAAAAERASGATKTDALEVAHAENRRRLASAWRGTTNPSEQK